MNDTTEPIRREMVKDLNENATVRAELEKQYGQVWNTEELQRDFFVVGFLAPFVEVKRKSDGEEGLLTFQHFPRFYFDFSS